MNPAAFFDPVVIGLSAAVLGIVLLEKQQRMDEKILALKNFLPQYIVENRKIYGILSKGIHELSEDICLKIFPYVKLGIELILDEKLYELEREEKLKANKKDLERIYASLGDN
jgi:hypothetical protein